MERIYIRMPGSHEHQGPFTSLELDTLWKSGDLAGSEYWHRTMLAWRATEEFAPPSQEVFSTPATTVLVSTLERSEQEIAQTLAVISAESVLGVSFVKDLFAQLSDMSGARSGVLEAELAKARQACMATLQTKAVSCRADGVLGVRFEHMQLTGQGKNMLAVTATGTAVRFADRPPR